MKMIKGKSVLIRADFNVPLGNNGKILDDTRIRLGLPTIQYALKNGAKKVIVISHLGRPNGEIVPELSLHKVAAHTAKLLKTPVKFIATWDFDVIKTTIADAKERVFMLENIRFQKGEESANTTFAKSLAELGDLFLNDAFATAHRAHTSTVAITRYIPSFPGLLLAKETETLNQIMKKPAQPLILIMGGAKMSEKLVAMESLGRIAESILVGGGLANTFFKAQGIEVGDSLVEDALMSKARWILHRAPIVLPVDVVVADPSTPKKTHIVAVDVTSTHICTAPERILDIGPKTRLLYAQKIKEAKTLLWNGPLGHYEEKPFDRGTIAIAKAIATSSAKHALSVVGGGETIDALDAAKASGSVSWISSGGGSLLLFFGQKQLPALAALTKRNS